MKRSALADLKVVLDQLIGNDNVLSNNILFIDFTGSHEKAQLLSQMWYWSGKTKDKHGWFFKTYQEWFDEIRVPEHSVRRFVEAFKKAGFVATCFKKVAGRPVIHYRLDKDVLIQKLVTFCEGNNLLGSHSVTLEPDNLQPSKEADNLQPSLYTEITLRDLNTESEDPAQFHVQVHSLETIPTVEGEVPRPAARPTSKISELQKNINAHSEAAEHFLRLLQTKGHSLNGAEKYAAAYFLNEQRKTRWVSLLIPTDAGAEHRWLGEHGPGIIQWAQRQPQFERNNGIQPTAPAAPVQIRREI
jgi:hypothetical protein